MYPNKRHCGYIHNNRLWAGWVSYRPHIGNIDKGMLVSKMLITVNIKNFTLIFVMVKNVYGQFAAKESCHTQASNKQAIIAPNFLPRFPSHPDVRITILNYTLPICTYILIITAQFRN